MTTKDTRTRRRCTQIRMITAAVLNMIALVATSSILLLGQPQANAKPLTISEVTYLLRNYVPPPRVCQLAKQKGIDFQLSGNDEKQLRLLGADSALIGTLRELAASKSQAVRGRQYPLDLPSSAQQRFEAKSKDQALNITRVTGTPLSTETDKHEAAQSTGQSPETSRRWAILLRGPDGSIPNDLVGAASAALRDRGYTIATAFVPRQVDDDSMTASILHRLQSVCNGLIEGRLEESLVTDSNPSMQGLITARVKISVRLFSTKTGAISSQFEISAKGGGFSEITASSQASQRLAVELRAHLIRNLP